MKTSLTLLAVLSFATLSTAQSFDEASTASQDKLQQSVAELSALREQMAAEKIPMSRELSALEAELTAVRGEFQQTTRLLDSRTLDLSTLRTAIKAREDENSYLSGLLGEYIRNFESRLHIAELQRYHDVLEAAKLAAENSDLSAQEVFGEQATLLSESLTRLEDATGGTRFPGTAVDKDGIVSKGTFLMVGPAALFASDDGATVGTAEQRLGSLEPAAVSFADPLLTADARTLVQDAKGVFPLDPTLGNAHKVAATEETFLEHVKRGGPVMWPIFIMASAAFLVALYKWLAMAFVRRPSRKKVAALLKAAGERDQDEATNIAQQLKGPVGDVLAVGVEHMKEPRELIEEVMYEVMLTRRLKLERMLPFISICAASAPLLGLLGTVTGIINTFKLITVFGSGDVKTLSGGISEALITTECGLIVAIPSLLMHAFLSRKARGIVTGMETASVAFVNQVSKAASHAHQAEAAAHLAKVGSPSERHGDDSDSGSTSKPTRSKRKGDGNGRATKDGTPDELLTTS